MSSLEEKLRKMTKEELVKWEQNRLRQLEEKERKAGRPIYEYEVEMAKQLAEMLPNLPLTAHALYLLVQEDPLWWFLDNHKVSPWVKILDLLEEERVHGVDWLRLNRWTGELRSWRVGVSNLRDELLEVDPAQAERLVSASMIGPEVMIQAENLAELGEMLIEGPAALVGDDGIETLMEWAENMAE